MKRAASKFAPVAMAGELAIEYGIVPWPEGAAFAAAVELFHAWGSQRGTKSNREPTQVLEQVANFLDRHGDSRFSPRKREVSVKDRAGWYDGEDGERLYLFTSQGLHEALKGFDFSPSLDILVAVGALPPRGKDGKHYLWAGT